MDRAQGAEHGWVDVRRDLPHGSVRHDDDDSAGPLGAKAGDFVKVRKPSSADGGSAPHDPGAGDLATAKDHDGVAGAVRDFGGCGDGIVTEDAGARIGAGKL